jgi:predicted cobalt transporter CbtA|tara:strand:- start:8013 stop:8213 length:201 start_codon:yes stop_codon:yes gene_type:complete
MIIEILLILAGFIAGILVARNNATKVNRAVEDVAELYEKAQAEIAELKTKAQKPAKKTTKKPTKKS